jgi:hypothetical protein
VAKIAAVRPVGAAAAAAGGGTMKEVIGPIRARP